MKRLLFIAPIFALFICTSCYHEDPLVPSDVVDKLLFDFPQGTNPYDRDIQKIQEEYGTYLIYKDIPDALLNRAWVNVYINTYYTADPVPDALVPWYVEFIQNNLLRYFKGGSYGQFLPKYIFLVSNMHMVMDGVSKPHKSAKMDGVDYWAVSFETTEAGALNRPDEKTARISLAYQVILNMLNAGKIEIPSSFYEGIDYKTMIYDDINNPDKQNSAYHYQTRGFVKYVQPTFEYDSPLTNIALAASSNEDFLMYVRKMLYSSTESFLLENGMYPKVMRRYEIVVDIFRKLGIDIVAIADGTEVTI